MEETERLLLYRKLRFLITDDFENFRKSLRQMLRSFGAEKIDTASSGNETVAKCTNEHFDVLLCDYNLGSGKNGQQTLEALRHQKLLKHTSLFVIVTAETSREIVMSAREYRPDTYIIKPITQASLKKRLDALLEQRQALYPIHHEIDLGNLPRAIGHCNQLIEQFPRYRMAILRIQADLHLQLKQFDKAQRIYEQVLGQRELAWARLGMGMVAMGEKDYKRAINEFETLIKNNRDFVEGYDRMAEAYRRLGKNQKAQDLLEQALDLSPLAVPRQRQMAEVAADNQDMERAAEAWRSTVRYSENSVHDSADVYLGLSRTLSELSDGDTTAEGREYAEEALSTLRALSARFKDDENAELQKSLIGARVYAGQGRTQESRKLLDKVKDRLDTDTMSPEQGLDYARALYSLSDPGAAQQVLNTLAQRFEDNPGIVNEIETLMDEPVSFQKKRQARRLNKEGIAAFERNDLSEASEAFNQALELVPQHPALNLNLVQVLLKSEKDTGSTPDPSVLKRCRRCLDQLDHLPEQHRQYKRYRHLKEKIDNLMSNL